MHIHILAVLWIGVSVYGTQGSTCGQRKVKLPTGVHFIIRGSYAKHGFWPWQVDLRTVTKRYDDGRYEFSSCGASILNNEWLVTAAHCVAHKGTKESDITVRMGSNSKKNEYDQGEVKMGIKRRIIHKGYVHGAKPIIDDIALLQLERPVTFSKYIQPVCLPTSKAKEGQRCTATGWGRNEGGYSRRTPDRLKKASYSIKYRAFARYSSCNNYQKSVLCAGSTSSICQGDSGGPLACPVNGRFVLYGVVSWVSEGCRKFNRPSGFADVYHFLPWIKRYIGSTSGGGGEPKPSPACVNKHRKCNIYARNGYCRHSFVNYMKKNCALACGLCNSTGSRPVCKRRKCVSSWTRRCYFSASKCACVCRHRGKK